MPRRKYPYAATACCATGAAVLYVVGLLTDPHALPWYGHCVVFPFLIAMAAFGGMIVDMIDQF